MRSRLLAVFLSLVAATTVFATAQRPDRLIYEGQSHSLNSNPLETYFADHPERHPRAADDGDTVSMSSALWRGYVATFEIERGILKLTDFHIRRRSADPDERPKPRSEIDRFFATPESRVLDWYSGILVLPDGPLRQYVHLSYASLYESYLMLRIENGRLTDAETFTAEEFVRFKRKQFAVYKQSDKYREELERLRDTTGDEASIEGFIYSYGSYVQHVLLDFDEAKAQ